MTSQKRVLILTTDAGLGHQSAAEAIAKALKHLYDDDAAVKIANVMAKERIPGLIRLGNDEYDQLVTEHADLYALGFELSDATVPASLMQAGMALFLSGAIRDLVRQHDPDVIVATHPSCQSPLSTVFRLENRHIPSLTVVTDLVTIHQLWFDKAIDLCIVPTKAAHDLALENGLSEDQIAVIGIPVDPVIATISKEPAELRAELGWRPDMQTLLVVGGKRVKHLREILHALNHANLSLQLVVVAGGDEAFYRRLQDIEWHSTVHTYNFVDNLPVMMKASDAIMCKAGGLIVTESLACGLPLLLVDVLPGQEQGNAEYVIEGGAAAMAKTPLAALETVYHWFELDHEHLAAKARRARELGRPHAAHKIAERIWRLG